MYFISSFFLFFFLSFFVFFHFLLFPFFFSSHSFLPSAPSFPANAYFLGVWWVLVLFVVCFFFFSRISLEVKCILGLSLKETRIIAVQVA